MLSESARERQNHPKLLVPQSMRHQSHGTYCICRPAKGSPVCPPYARLGATPLGSAVLLFPPSQKSVLVGATAPSPARPSHSPAPGRRRAAPINQEMPNVRPCATQPRPTDTSCWPCHTRRTRSMPAEHHASHTRWPCARPHWRTAALPSALQEGNPPLAARGAPLTYIHHSR